MSGAPFRAIAPANSKSIEIKENPKEQMKIGDSGTKRVQTFCEEVRAELFATDIKRTMHNIRIGLFVQRMK